MRPATEQSKPSAVVSAGNTWPSDKLWYRQSPEADRHRFSFQSRPKSSTVRLLISTAYIQDAPDGHVTTYANEPASEERVHATFF